MSGAGEVWLIWLVVGGVTLVLAVVAYKMDAGPDLRADARMFAPWLRRLAFGLVWAAAAVAITFFVASYSLGSFSDREASIVGLLILVLVLARFAGFKVMAVFMWAAVMAAIGTAGSLVFSDSEIWGASFVGLRVFGVVIVGFSVFAVIAMALRGVRWSMCAVAPVLRSVAEWVASKLAFFFHAAFILAMVASVVFLALLGIEWYFDLEVATGKGWIPLVVCVCLWIATFVLDWLAERYGRRSKQGATRAGGLDHSIPNKREVK